MTTQTRAFTFEDLKDLLGIPFSAQQEAAITAPLSPAVVVAGAGSGKTTVMAARAVWLVATGQVRPEQILGLTFTNKAAAELGKRIRENLAQLRDRVGGVHDVGQPGEPDEPGEPTIATYHSFAKTLIADHGLRLGIEPGFTLLEEAAALQLSYEIIASADWVPKAVEQRPQDVAGSIISLDDAMAEQALDTEVVRAHSLKVIAELNDLERNSAKGLTLPQKAVRTTAQARLDLLDAVLRLRAERERLEVASFADLMRHGARLAQTRAEVGRLLREQYPVVLLDEYQDTSVAQRLMLSGLFADVAGEPTGHAVMAVGDPFQAIYGWRGASVDNIDNFPVHYRNADGSDAAIYNLAENRRSGPRILEVANRVAEPLLKHHPAAKPLEPKGVGHGDGDVRIALLERWIDEVDWVADQVEQAIADGISPGSIAVLGNRKTNFHDVRTVLNQRGIAVEVTGLGGLLGLPEIQEIVAVLKVLDDPTANAALVRILAGARWALGPRDLAVIGSHAKELAGVRRTRGGDSLTAAVDQVDPADVASISDAIDDLRDAPVSDAARERLTRLASELRVLRRHVGDPLVDLVTRVISTIGLDVEIRASQGALAAGQLESVSAFVDVCGRFQGTRGQASLAAFLDYLDAVERFGKEIDFAPPPARDAVQLMTVHKAKGLEWDAVAVVGLSAGQFPSRTSRPLWTKNPHVLPSVLRRDADSLPQLRGWTGKDLTDFSDDCKADEHLEQLRLGYVALTRPHRRLLLSGSYWGPTQKTPRGPSVILEQAAERLREFGVEPLDWTPAPEDGLQNPYLVDPEPVLWLGGEKQDPMLAVAARAVRELLAAESLAAESDVLVPEDEWGADVDALIEAELAARSTEVEVVLPEQLSASAVMALRKDPEVFAIGLRRPMPRKPSRAAHRGTFFHSWVEARFGQDPSLIAIDELEGGSEDDVLADVDIELLQETFEKGPYANLQPAAVEVPFTVLIGGHVIIGVIDAVFEGAGVEGPGGGFRWQIVDWKTNKAKDADSLQLAIYRLAWADLKGCEPEEIDAVFYYVHPAHGDAGAVVRPDMMTRAEIEAALLVPEP